jgi:hypothetical protein
MAYYAWKVVSHSYRLGARPNSTLDIPLSLPQSIWAIGLTWFALVAFVMALRAVVHLMRGDFALVNDEMGIPSGDPHETLR